MGTKTVRRAKVTLYGAKSYRLAGKKFKKGESQIIKGSMVEEFENNGFFKCRELEPVEKTVKKKKKKSSSSGSKKKKKTKKKSSKKVTKKTKK